MAFHPYLFRFGIGFALCRKTVTMKKKGLLILLMASTVAQLTAQNASSVCPANMIVQAETGKEGANVNFRDTAGSTFTPLSGSFFRLGSHSVIVSNAAGQKCSFTVMVTDNESPNLSLLSLSRSVLRPDNSKMKKVNVFYTATDNGENVKTSLSVTSNASDGLKDYEIIDDHLVRLKSSRLPDGSVRTYTITVIAIDDAGNKTTRSTTLSVARRVTDIAAPN